MMSFNVVVRRLAVLAATVTILGNPIVASIANSSSLLSPELADDPVLKPNGIPPGWSVKRGTKLRILGVGDSITVGFRSGDGNGYRLQLRNDLSSNMSISQNML